MRHPTASRVLWLAASVAACGPAPVPTTDRPSLTLLDSIVLQETDSTLLADLGPYVTIDTEGDLYVTEQQSSRVLRFRPSGQLATVYGRRGRGPGEFGFVGPVVLVVDSLVLVEANFRGRIQLFDRESGNYLRSVPFTGVNLTAGVATGTHFVWGNMRRTADRTVMVARRDSVLGPLASQRPALAPTLHPMPPEYHRYPDLEGFYLVPVAAWGDTMAVGFAAVNWIVRSRLDGTTIDSVDVPIRRRRGVSPSALEAFGARPFDFERAYEALSLTYAIWRLPDKSFVLWYQDGSVEVSAPGRMQITGRAYVSVLAPDLTAACVDAEVEARGTNRPRLAMRADTLYALDQMLDVAARTGLRTVVRRYLLSVAGCAWEPTHRRGR